MLNRVALETTNFQNIMSYANLLGYERLENDRKRGTSIYWKDWPPALVARFFYLLSY